MTENDSHAPKGLHGMNVLQVSPYVIEPPSTGGDHRTHGLVKEIPKRGGAVTRYCQGGSPKVYAALDFRRTVRVDNMYLERRGFSPIHDAAMTPVLLGYPNVFANRALEAAPGPLQDALDACDIVLVREPWQVPAVLSRTTKPVVYSSHNVETDRFRDITSGPFASRAIDRAEELERLAIEGTDATVCTSESDVRRYGELFDPDGSLFVLPNGTYESDIRAHRPDSVAANSLRHEYGVDREATVVIFVGSNYGPNVKAARRIIEFAERVRDRSIHFLIVGSVGAAVNAPQQHVTTTGFVDDLEAHFDLADIAINPIEQGGGTNIKLLDYFARSLPVVTTPFGARGINVENKKHLLIKDIKEFLSGIGELIDEPIRRQQLGRAGRSLVAESYTWEAASNQLYNILKRLLDE